MFIIKKDIYDFFKKNLKLIIGALLIIICYSIYSKANYNNSKLFILTLGLKRYNDFFFIDVLIYIIHICVGLYITLWIFYGMFKSNIECLFLRLSIKKWFLYKQISILLIIAIIKFIFYALSIYLSGYHNFLKIFYYFFVDNIFTNVLGLISIILLIIFYKNRLVSLITLIILIGFVSFIKVPVSVIDIINTNVLVLIVIYFLLLLIAIIFIKNMYVSLFEGSKER